MNINQPAYKVIAFAAFLLMIAVALGAFGSHGLKARVGDYELSVWNTAVLYQLIHSLGAMVISLIHCFNNKRIFLTAAALMLFGSVIFSGSLYTLVLSGKHWLGAITPVGGFLFIVSWLLVVIAAIKVNK